MSNTSMTDPVSIVVHSSEAVAKCLANMGHQVMEAVNFAGKGISGALGHAAKDLAQVAQLATKGITSGH